MKSVRTAVMVALALAVAGSPAAQRAERMTEGLTLTAEQKAKLGEVCKDLGPKLMEAMKKVDVLTPEQKKAEAEARKAAKEAGKTGKEASDAVAAAVKMTEEQKSKQAAGRKEMAALEKELREKVTAVLTAEQKEQLKKKAEEAKKKAEEAKKPTK
jgi:hypothetical protein